MPVLPSKWWAGKDFEKTSLEPALGSGAYKVDAVDVGRSISYRRVPDWWAKDLWMMRGRNNFEVDALRLLPRQQHRVRGVQGRRHRHPPRELRPQLEDASYDDLPAVKDGRIVRAEITHENPTPMQGFIFNLRREIFKDRRVREAIGAGVRLRMAEQEPELRLLYPHALLLRQLRARGQGPALARGAQDPRAAASGKIPDEVFTAEFNPPKTDGSGNFREQAAQGASAC